MHPIRDAIVIVLAWWVATWAAFAHSQDTTTGLVHRWKLQESTGTSATDIVGSNTATLAGTDFDTAGEAAGPGTALTRAVHLDGGDDYLEAASAVTLSGTYTLCGWAKRDTTNTYDMIIGNTATAAMYGFTNSSANLWIRPRAGTGYSVAHGVTTTAWHFYAFTRDSSNNVKWSVDGGAWSSTVATVSGDEVLRRIGTDNTATLGNDGYLCDVRIYNTAKTQADLVAIMAEKDVTWKPLIMVTE